MQAISKNTARRYIAGYQTNNDQMHTIFYVFTLHSLTTPEDGTETAVEPITEPG
jgi:hypothetical protein